MSLNIGPHTPQASNSHAINVLAAFVGSWSEFCVLRKCYQVNEFLLTQSSVPALLGKHTQNLIPGISPWILQIYAHQFLLFFYCVISFLLCHSKQVASQIMLSLNHGYPPQGSWRWVSVPLCYLSSEGKDYLPWGGGWASSPSHDSSGGLHNPNRLLHPFMFQVQIIVSRVLNLA